MNQVVASAYSSCPIVDMVMRSCACLIIVPFVSIGIHWCWCVRSVHSFHEDKTIGPVNLGNPNEFTVKDSQAAHRKNTVLHCLEWGVQIEFKPNESSTSYSMLFRYSCCSRWNRCLHCGHEWICPHSRFKACKDQRILSMKQRCFCIFLFQFYLLSMSQSVCVISYSMPLWLWCGTVGPCVQRQELAEMIVELTGSQSNWP